MSSKKGFTLVELMVVILIVAILASVAIPMMRGRIDSAKWSEAAATAGTIRSAVKAAFAQDPALVGSAGDLGTSTVRTNLGFGQTDLEGTYFTADDYDYTCTADESGGAVVVVNVTPSQDNAPQGEGELNDTGWHVNEASEI